MSKRHADHAMLDNAKANKNDEFYTQYADIERELKHYSFHGKVVLCNCDDPRISNFYKYFVDRFDELGIRKLICSCYNSADNDPFDNADGGVGFWYSYDGMGKKIPDLDDCHMFNGDGDFRRGEALDLAREADIVVTNPPFSLFREYVVKMENLGKLFLVIGNINAITYKDIFGLIQNNRAWLGVNLGRGISGFIVPDNYILYGQEARIENGKRIVATNSCLWLTNMDNSCRHAKIPLVKEYKDGYKKYDNYDGSEVVSAAQKADAVSQAQTAMETRLQAAETKLGDYDTLLSAVKSLQDTVKTLTDELEAAKTREATALDSMKDMQSKLALFTDLKPPASQSSETLLNDREKSLVDSVMGAAKAADTPSLVDTLIGGQPAIT